MDEKLNELKNLQMKAQDKKMLSEAKEFEHEIKEINKIKDKIKSQTLDRAITEAIKSKAEIASKETAELNGEYLEIITHLDKVRYERFNK